MVRFIQTTTFLLALAGVQAGKPADAGKKEEESAGSLPLGVKPEYSETRNGLPSQEFSDNPNCADLGYDYGWKDEGCFEGNKLFTELDTSTQVKSGATCDASSVAGTVDIKCSGDGEFKDATIQADVPMVVIMKGGNGGTIYSGLEANTEYTIDIGPARKGISHIEFCFDCGAPAPTGGSDPEPEPEPTPTGGDSGEETPSGGGGSGGGSGGSGGGGSGGGGSGGGGRGGSADETCDANMKVGPGNGGDYRCCAGFYNGGASFGECETSSCVENFNMKNLNCFNFGSPQHPSDVDYASLSDTKKGGSAICPYVESDRAICDTSFYTDLNGENCRENGKNHCLGKVKCMTDGVDVPKNGNSDGTASGGGACASSKYPEGTDCFYNGNSENWKVCGDDGDEDGDEPDDRTVDPPTPPKKGSGSGDPHFKTWTGDKYDYHGECDLVLVDHPSFADGKGLRVHVRTTRVKYFSYIEKVAVQIGEDVLEFSNDVDKFTVNGKEVGPNRKHQRTLLGGFLVRRDARSVSIRLHDDGLESRLSHTVAKIDLHTRKNGFPAVIVDGGETDVFKGSLGLLGDWDSGKRIARDGATEMGGHDATPFALEWQVRDTEPMLFNEARFPQFPTTCTPPAKMSTKLGQSNFQKEAEKACAHWKEDIEDCIFDVIATRDVMVAAEGHVEAQ